MFSTSLSLEQVLADLEGEEGGLMPLLDPPQANVESSEGARKSGGKKRPRTELYKGQRSRKRIQEHIGKRIRENTVVVGSHGDLTASVFTSGTTPKITIIRAGNR